MYVTKHAETRIKERSGIPKKAAYRSASIALEKGVERRDTKGRLRTWLDQKYRNYSGEFNLYVYGDKAYIFDQDCLITVLQVPNKLVKDVKNAIIKNSR